MVEIPLFGALVVNQFIGYVCQEIGLDFVKSKKKISKLIPIFLPFYITSIIFYHFSNKKITTKQKISFFYTKYSYFFSHINQI
jgi:hypothetical protein